MHWHDVAPHALNGKVVIVTGATSGIGMATAEAVAKLGATTVMVARNAPKAEAVRGKLLQNNPAAVISVEIADMTDLEAVRHAAANIANAHSNVHALIHNAGALDAKFSTNAQGLECTAASQVVAPFLMTAMLEPTLHAASNARVIWVASGGMYSQGLDVAALSSTATTYDGVKAYARCKRAQVTLAELFAQRWATTTTTAHSMHPGWASTPGVVTSLPTFAKITGPILRSPALGADTIVWLTADDAPTQASGTFWLDRRARPTHRLKSTRALDTTAARRALWQWCNEQAHRDLAFP